MSKPIKIPNVSSVPLYSPFRYPGGKSRLYNVAVQWLAYTNASPKILVEPFAGAAHIGLAMAIEELVEKVVLVELDEDISATWQTILGEDCQWLLDKIQDFAVTPSNVAEILEGPVNSLRDRAFRVLLRNRLSRGGIVAPGSGTLERGEDNRGLKSRWYPETLCKRIKLIHDARQRISFIYGDGLQYLRNNIDSTKYVYFIDPPYTEAGRRLYRHFDVDLGSVFETVSKLAGNFILTYNSTEIVARMVSNYSLQMRQIAIYTTHHREKYELLIARDLSFLADDKEVSS